METALKKIGCAWERGKMIDGCIVHVLWYEAEGAKNGIVTIEEFHEAGMGRRTRTKQFNGRSYETLKKAKEAAELRAVEIIRKRFKESEV